MSDVHSEVHGKITVISPNGYGFFVPDSMDTLITRNIFFHAKDVIGIDENFEWKDIRKGLVVTAEMVILTNKGYQAFEVNIIGMSSKRQPKNRNF